MHKILRYEQTNETEVGAFHVHSFSRDYVRLNTDIELGYNDIGLRDTSSITSDDLWYQLIPHR